MFKPKHSVRTLTVLFVIMVFSLALVTPGIAQDTTPPIVLDDTTPSIDAVITPVDNTAGVVMLELDRVRVHLITAANVEILTIADARIQSFAFQFASGAAPHVLRVERLSGVTIGRVKLLPQSALPIAIAPTSTTPITTLTNPVSGSLPVATTAALPIVATTGANMFSAQVLAESTVQLTDSTGAVLFTMQTGKGGIQALTARLAPGLYLAKFTNKDVNAKSEVTIALSNAPDLTLGTAVPTVAGSQIAITTKRPVVTATRGTPRPPQPTVRATDDHGGHGGDDGNDDHGDNSGHGGGDDGGGHD